MNTLLGYFYEIFKNMMSKEFDETLRWGLRAKVVYEVF